MSRGYELAHSRVFRRGAENRVAGCVAREGGWSLVTEKKTWERGNGASGAGLEELQGVCSFTCDEEPVKGVEEGFRDVDLFLSVDQKVSGVGVSGAVVTDSGREVFSCVMPT